MSYGVLLLGRGRAFLPAPGLAAVRHLLVTSPTPRIEQRGRPRKPMGSDRLR